MKTRPLNNEIETAPHVAEAEAEQRSVFSWRTLPELYEEIRDTYERYPHPWVIGYSGGKDSTAVLQLIWNALEALPPERRQKAVYVVASDTKVEDTRYRRFHRQHISDDKRAGSGNGDAIRREEGYPNPFRQLLGQPDRPWVSRADDQVSVVHGPDEDFARQQVHFGTSGRIWGSHRGSRRPEGGKFYAGAAHADL